MSEKDREEAVRLVSGYYWCDRVGTMHEDDFYPAEECELVDEVVAAFARVRAKALREAAERAVDFCSSWNINGDWLRAAILADEPKEGE